MVSIQLLLPTTASAGTDAMTPLAETSASFAPADSIVSNTATDSDHALRQIETLLKGERRGVDVPTVAQGTADPES